MRQTILTAAGALALCVAAQVAAAASTQAAELNIYSYRQEFLIKPLLEQFEEKRDVTVNTVYMKKGMIERLLAEGANTPADIVLTSDVARLQALADAGVLQSVRSAVLDANIPAQYHGPDGLWYGLTTRARVIYYAKDRVAPEHLSTYEDLADPKWRGRICMRSGHHIYNRGLIAAMIAHSGESATEAWLRDVKANLARRPQGNDRAQIKAIKEGLCDLSIGNTYYMGKMRADPEQRPWADAVAIFFPNQENRGTHVNISGAAATKSGPHPESAIAFLEFLSSGAGQQLYAEQNFEYPVNPATAWHPEVESWGRFAPDTLPLELIATNGAGATRLVDRVGFDD
jgi:iron(III) transport system substrate-binding protein